VHTRQVGFHFDQSRCSGCLTCILACKQWHSSVSEARNWRRVLTVEKGQYPHLKISFFSFSCFHCEIPLCLSTCPTSAIDKKEENGIVLVSPDLCLGEQACGLCKDSCPYHVPVFSPEAGLKMEKCDFCTERMASGKRPICVEACPMRALDAGDLEEMRKKYGKGTEAEGFHYSLETRPSIILRRK
jgi:anaerobic dimethyl sulfoxide reductase subunit B